MRKATIFFVLCFWVFASHSQYITIPDTAFVSWLHTHGLDSCMNGNQLDTTCPAVLNKTSLSINNLPIRNLTGIQYFKNVTILNCVQDSLSFLPSFPPTLTHIDCERNQLSSIPVLPDSLQLLNCSSNRLTSLPSLPASLLGLICDENLIGHLPTLNQGLLTLSCFLNQLNDLPVLPHSLSSLSCGSNQLTALPFLTISITDLECDGNQISNLLPFPPNLKYLRCGNNLLSSLPTLPAGLKYLDCSGNKLSYLPQLPAKLTSLYCSMNKLLDIPLLPDSLQLLYTAFNGLRGLPLIPSTLTFLDCDHDSLISLPELPDSLYYFNCSYNPSLKCLPALKKLGSFIYNNTGIACLPDSSIRVTGYCMPPLNSVPLCAADDTNGCQVYTRLKESFDFGRLSIYPNPTKQYLIGSFTSIPQKLTAEIISPDGRVLKSNIAINNQSFEIDVSALATGVYFLVAHSGEEKLVKKFVKE